MRKADQTIRELASILCTNAVLAGDPRSQGATDCYLVTLDDFTALYEALKPSAPSADAWLRISAPSVKRALEVALAGDHTVTVIGHPENGEDDLKAIMFDHLAFVKPCPCGSWNDPIRECLCSPMKINQYRSTKAYRAACRSEIIIRLPSPRPADLIAEHADREPLADVLARVQRAKDFEEHTCFNRDPIMSADDTALLSRAIMRLCLTKEQVDAIKRVARTIANLDGALERSTAHLAEAIAYQSLLKEIEL